MLKNFYIINYGCQMNIYDNEIIISILTKNKYNYVKDIFKADIILINTCSIREKAEITVINKLIYLNSLKKKKKIFIGIIGCMARRIQKFIKIKKRIIDFIVGPDNYRELPNIIKSIEDNRYFINILLSNEETYSNIFPSKIYNINKVTSYVTISRGCDNMCTFCVVPFTRGRERSKSPNVIIKECERLYNYGYKEITLLGQNVDSYLWTPETHIKKNIKDKKKAIDFSNLLEIIAKKFNNIRFRFSTSNPHDMSIRVLKVIKKYNNICKYIHLPVQSGSNRILKLMNRKYSRLEYINLIDNIKNIIPECAISYDIITGFCTETEKDHIDTLNLMKYVKYDFGYMFMYSHREGTYSYNKLKDNVPLIIKKRRLNEIIKLQRKHSYNKLKKYINTVQNVLIEGDSKKDNNYWYGRNSQNTLIVFKKNNESIGEYVNVKILKNTSATLIGEREKKY
ncbi:MAG: tRNA (N6-isopentenyl adenosine(37)-C2)-methylthiotransferase MiaB [Candidatus Shikimatogenerans bostrichidophilus]|nr:MAG: tRNA (N6-isopentenyl adenosine(37)-C2)-methylthiotransferase MiaB [Candidatus Shikimatogenerans bostrichidophilus]